MNINLTCCIIIHFLIKCTKRLKKFNKRILEFSVTDELIMKNRLDSITRLCTFATEKSTTVFIYRVSVSMWSIMEIKDWLKFMHWLKYFPAKNHHNSIIKPAIGLISILNSSVSNDWTWKVKTQMTFACHVYLYNFK